MLVVRQTSNGQPGLPAEPGYVAMLFPFRAIARPGVFLVAHVFYLGPLFLLAVLLWGRICDELRRFGPGPTLSLALGAGFALNSETRHSSMFVPLLVPFVVLAVERLRWAKWKYVAFAACSFVVSKAWLPINGGSTSLVADTGTAPPPVYADPRYSLFFMNIGPWMSDRAYFLAIATSVVLGIAMYAALVREGARKAIPA
jgi:hypothetical protein